LSTAAGKPTNSSGVMEAGNGGGEKKKKGKYFWFLLIEKNSL
jgi:hypothetical protein